MMKGLYGRAVFRKQILSLFIIMIFLGCSSVGKRVVPESEVLSRREIIQRSIEKVERDFNEAIPPKNVGIYKKGYRDWKVILYSKGSFYLIYMAEDGEVISIEKKDYVKR